MTRHRDVRAVVLVPVLVLALAGCSSTAADTAASSVAPAPTTPVVTVATTPAANASTVGSTTSTAAPPTAASVPAAQPTVPAPAESTSPPAVVPVTDPPATGLPGASSTDVFCSMYGPLLVSVYLIGLSEAFAVDPLEPRRIELAASYSVDNGYRSAIDLMPAQLRPDLAAFEARWGPFADRAATGIETIGRSELAGELFPERWTVVLTEHDRNDPAIDLGLDATTSAVLDALVPDFASQVGSIGDDLAVARGAGVATPLIDAHVATFCPDLAAVGAPDAV